MVPGSAPLSQGQSLLIDGESILGICDFLGELAVLRLYLGAGVHSSTTLPFNSLILLSSWKMYYRLEASRREVSPLSLL